MSREHGKEHVPRKTAAFMEMKRKTGRSVGNRRTSIVSGNTNTSGRNHDSRKKLALKMIINRQKREKVNHLLFGSASHKSQSQYSDNQSRSDNGKSERNRRRIRRKELQTPRRNGLTASNRRKMDEVSRSGRETKYSDNGDNSDTSSLNGKIKDALKGKKLGFRHKSKESSPRNPHEKKKG